MAVVDYFLKIDGIAGESQDAKHKGEIEIDSFSWGVSQTGAHSAGGGGGAGKVSFQDIHFTKSIDKASPTLMLACAKGDHIKSAILVARGPRGPKGEPQEFLKVTFSDVLVSSYQDAGDPNAVRDAASLRYAKVTETFGQPQTIAIQPAANGNLVFDPTKTPPIQFVEGPGGALVAGSTGGVRSRGIAEFDFMILIGLLTAPFSTAKLSLEVQQVRLQPPGPPTDVTHLTSADSGSGVTALGAEPHLLATFGVFFYQPADLHITADDFRRPARRIGTIRIDITDPNAPLGAFDVDLTRLITRRHHDGEPQPVGTGGIRIQLLGVRTADDGDADHEGKHDDDDGDKEPREEEDDRDGDTTLPPSVVAAFVASLVFDSA